MQSEQQLEHDHAGQDHASAPPPGQPQQANFSGFAYDSLGFKFPRKLCVEWLRLQAKEYFSLQPYEQLAKVLMATSGGGPSYGIACLDSVLGTDINPIGLFTECSSSYLYGRGAFKVGTVAT